MNDFYNLIGAASDEQIREWLMADGWNLLYAELFIAELQARKGGKRKTYDTHAFEVNLHENLTRLANALWYYEYRPSRGTAHVIFKPVQREIFADGKALSATVYPDLDADKITLDVDADYCKYVREKVL